ncbi:MAG: MFS transporter [Candidatus Wallbacteria bacterium]|nr:MFS transporter [Candidatus Wallbacteria bacterium]
MSSLEALSPHPTFPQGFRPRRGLNWMCVGLTYASFYLCRYNLRMTKTQICQEYHFSNSDFGLILTGFFWTYAIGQLCNGLFTDKLGGKKAMLIGATGTVILNIVFGLTSMNSQSVVLPLLYMFVLVRMVDGWAQSFGAPGMIKINSAWFNKNERGRFAGIFGFMIQLGQIGIGWLAPALLSGFTIAFLTVPPLHWKWVFFVPAALCSVAASLVALFVKNSPEECGYEGVIHDEVAAAEGSASEEAPPISVVLKKILGNRMVWLVAAAYFCTGAVRQGIDQWFPAYLEEVHHVSKSSATFALILTALPTVAVIGSFLSGYISDVFFGGRRAPVAAILYFGQTVVMLAAAQFSGLYTMCFFLVLISFAVNSTHSILGTAAAMDIGGRKMAGFASGVIDSFQYFGGGLAGFFLGWLLDKFGWHAWLYSLAGFGVIGGGLMLLAMKLQSAGAPAKAAGH